MFLNYNPYAFVESVGEHVYTTTGAHTWICPSGVTKISVLCVGGGGGGVQDLTNGTAGGTSSFYKGSTLVCNAQGGQYQTGGGYNVSCTGGAGGTYNLGSGISGGGGHGGNGGGVQINANTSFYNYGSCGGGGAGGYAGNGGSGYYQTTSVSIGYGAETGSGGGGSGRNQSWGYSSFGGGGVGLYGKGSDGAAQGFGGSGGQSTGDRYGGDYGGGSGSTADHNSYCWGGGGGGGLVYANNYAVTPGTSYTVTVGEAGYFGTYAGGGGNGAIRIIWGPNRSFPSTNVTLADSKGNVSTN
jgi:hypothetical protein